ncbi:unnamed protein product [Lepeophtheirus salmonis]|uniref:(salmon louse) hypothetical protein n=1 Tax=Lepeophtheirus salmonis TaxID=72036 RepID=A0A7R8H1M9_LEPSM|nr:unnamed protein product [Lepeophtheirus salmonis]CAF2796871.1 unnamed protein product [Lepeophtheirus salmonis]
MDNNFFGEIEDFLESFGSPGSNLSPITTSHSKYEYKYQSCIRGTLKVPKRCGKERKLEEETTSLGSPGFGEITKNAKLDDSSSELCSEQELPRAPNRSTTLLAQALTEKRPISNPSNNSILDPVSGALTKDDHHLYDDEHIVNKGGPSVPSQGESGFPPPLPHSVPFDPQLASPIGSPKDSLDSLHLIPLSSTAGATHDDEAQWDQQPQMRPMMMRQDFNNRPQMNVQFPNEFGINPRGFNASGNSNNVGNNFPPKPGNNNTPPNMLMHQQYPPENFNNYNSQGPHLPSQRMNYGSMIPPPNGSPRMNSPGNVRFDQQQPSQQFEYNGNRFGNRYPEYSLNNPGNATTTNNFQPQRSPYSRPPMQQNSPLPPATTSSSAASTATTAERVFQHFYQGKSPFRFITDLPIMNHSQPQTLHHHHHQAHHPHHPQQPLPPPTQQQQPPLQTDFEYSSWKNDASEIRKSLLDNLQKALGQEDSNTAYIAEQVESEAFTGFGQVQQQPQDDYHQSASVSSNGPTSNNCPNSSSSPSTQNSNSIPDSTNTWTDPPAPDVSSTELIDGVLGLDSSDKGNKKGNNNGSGTDGTANTSANNNSTSGTKSVGSSNSDSSSEVRDNNSGSSVVGNSNSSKSQVHPILSSLLPAPPSSSSSSKNGASAVVTSDSFQSPLSLSSTFSSTSTTTTTAPIRGGNGSNVNPNPNSNSVTAAPVIAVANTNTTNVVNNPHSVDSGIGSPRSITSSSLYSPKIPQGTSPSLIPNSEKLTG